MSLMSELNQKALRQGVPLSVHLDVTYRCNERCEHCYLDHEGDGKDQYHQFQEGPSRAEPAWARSPS